MATQADPRELELQEQLARIRLHMADIDARYEEMKKWRAETSRVELDLKFAPWQFAVGGVTAGAALVGATAAIVKIFF